MKQEIVRLTRQTAILLNDSFINSFFFFLYFAPYSEVCNFYSRIGKFVNSNLAAKAIVPW